MLEYDSMQKQKSNLIHHISRLEGQLASIKRELARDTPDCKKAALTLKASARSFASLRLSFVDCFLEEKFIRKNQKDQSTYDALLQVINA